MFESKHEARVGLDGEASMSKGEAVHADKLRSAEVGRRGKVNVVLIKCILYVFGGVFFDGVGHEWRRDGRRNRSIMVFGMRTQKERHSLSCFFFIRL